MLHLNKQTRIGLWCLTGLLLVIAVVTTVVTVSGEPEPVAYTVPSYGTAEDGTSLTTEYETATKESELPVGVEAMADSLIYLYIAVVIIGAIAWIGSRTGG